MSRSSATATIVIIRLLLLLLIFISYCSLVIAVPSSSPSTTLAPSIAFVSSFTNHKTKKSRLFETPHSDNNNNDGDDSTTTMSSSSSTKCIPCSSLDDSSMFKSKEQIQTRLEYMSLTPNWKIIEQTMTRSTKSSGEVEKNEEEHYYCLSRKFIAKNFQSAMKVLNDMSIIAEREGHHPDFHLTNYRTVEIILYTHKIHGITENDFILAQKLDTEVSIEYSPKWLKEYTHTHTHT